MQQYQPKPKSDPLKPHPVKKETPMFGSKTKKEKLEAKYAKLLEEAYNLSTVSRKKSDFKAAEADEVRKQLDALDNE